MNKWGWMEEELGMLQEQHLYRQVKVIESAQSSHVQYRGRDMLMLASNSYLDLCAQDCIKEYAAQVQRVWHRFRRFQAHHRNYEDTYGIGGESGAV